MAPKFALSKPVVTKTTSLNPKAASSIVSADGRSVAIVFGDRNLGDLQIGLGAPEKVLSATKLVTFRAKVTAPDDRSFFGYRQVLRGFVNKGPGSRVVIVADIAGMTELIEYPFGEAVENEDFVHAFVSPDVNLTTGNDEVAPLPEYAGTITLLVQTRSPEDGVLAAIDSLDVEALLAGAPVEAPKPTPAKKR
jgi:hypothetical protein